MANRLFLLECPEALQFAATILQEQSSKYNRLAQSKICRPVTAIAFRRNAGILYDAAGILKEIGRQYDDG